MINAQIYDYIIIGGGPSGLTLAHILPKDKKILILEKQNVIGGCHRVDRVDNYLFTEHGPRVYSSAYVNFNKILRDLGTSLDKSFTEYNFTVSEIGGKGIPNFSTKEILKFTTAFLVFLINPNYGSNISMSEFSVDFSPESKDYIDRLCRLTDGASSENYTLKEFLSIINDQGLQTLYQPIKPNDIGIMALWYNYLINKGVDIITGTEVYSIETTNGNGGGNGGGNKVVSVNGKYFADKFIFAMPPKTLSDLLTNQTDELTRNAFGPQFSTYADKTNYIEYIPITFHWTNRLTLPKIYGFPSSDWGLIFIVLSDYMLEVDNSSDNGGTGGTVISTTITYTDKVSKNNGKTATDCTKDELLIEAFHQLKEAFPDLPDPDYSLLSPTVNRINNRWKTQDTAFASVSGAKSLDFKSTLFDNLYNLGPQNGYEKYHFSSLESAISNSFVLGYVLENTNYTVSGFTTVRQVLIIIVLLVVFIVFYLVKVSNKNK